MSVEDIKEETFEKEVLQSKTPVIVDVWAEWCGPCRLYSPIIEEVSNDYKDKIRFVKLNADENQKIVEKYNIMSIPTTLLIEKGEVKAMRVGLALKEDLKKWINKNV